MAKNLPDLSLESKVSGVVAGVDEAGRGPWAGPVVAAGVVLDHQNIPMGINDSKKLSKVKRERVFKEIHQTCHVGIGIVDAEEIDRINILEATKYAMVKAIEELPVIPDMVLIDGNQAPNVSYQTNTVVKGDNVSLSIAAASIIAKVTRDRIMQDLHQQFPHYGWDRNAGYGTKEHHSKLLEYGPTPFHRRSFAPIKKLLVTQ